MSKADFHPLSFATLREANTACLPMFKNRHGGLAHNKEDGSDWSVAQWLQATLGELGEFAEVRVQYELGNLAPDLYEEAAAKELADFVTYADILARRALDKTTMLCSGIDAPQLLMVVIAYLGSYANLRKKMERGDIAREAFEAQKVMPLQRAAFLIQQLIDGAHVGKNETIRSHPTGIDLGKAVADKFNECSDRVGCGVKISGDDFAIGDNDV